MAEPAKTSSNEALDPETEDMEEEADSEDNPAEFLKAEDTQIVSSDTMPAGDATASQSSRAGEAGSVKDLLQPPDDPGKDASSIEKNVRYFSVTVKNHFSRWLARSGKYIDMMKGIFRENYLPEELVFLALIESGFNPKAYSFAKACGPWQFIKGTATKYGLKVNRWVDERRDPVKSTRAAARYLKDLYGMFGDWQLAMASYNAGEGNVARAVNRNGTMDFWELRKTRSLAPETREYVPRFLAAKMIAQDPDRFGFEGLEYEQPFEFDEVVLDKCTDLEVVAKCCEAPVSEIKELNPELIRWCTPPNYPSYTLRIPKGTKEKFLANYENLPEEEKIAKPRHEDLRDYYVVRRGDTLKGIARKLHVSALTLAQANNMKTTARLRPGKRIALPGTVAEEPSGGKRSKTKTAYYKVRKGDTLSSIARRHKTSASRLASLNGISARSALRAGQRLKVSSTRTTSAEVGSSPAGRGKTYKVRNGDTLWSISKKFGVSREALLKANSLNDSPTIKIGQKLVIPEKEAA